LPYCDANSIGVIAYSPMQAGLLTGKFTPERVAQLPDNDWRKSNPYFTQPQFDQHLATVESLKPISEELGVTLSQLALAWILRRPEMTAAIAGARRPDQITETVKAGEIELSSDVIERLDQILA